MYEIFDSSSNKMAKFLRELTEKGEVEIEVRSVFTRYTMDVISSAAFGLDSQSFADTESEFVKMAKRIQSVATVQMIKMILVLLFPKLFTTFRIPVSDTKSISFFADATRRAIQHREATGEVRDDFLQLLIEAKNDELKEKGVVEENEPEIPKSGKMKLTESHILAQSILFFFAGFDTAETLLIFAAYELAVNPEIQETLYAELKETYESNNKLSYDLVMKMEYLDKVISETLRKYPPGFRTERVASKSYRIPDSDVILDKGTTIAVPIYAIHHDSGKLNFVSFLDIRNQNLEIRTQFRILSES